MAAEERARIVMAANEPRFAERRLRQPSRCSQTVASALPVHHVFIVSCPRMGPATGAAASDRRGSSGRPPGHGHGT